ncbi:hypothetical protein LBMAG56_04380 [Verrucomicrobiota bacterium]|nr:hypothetical protein LBMAG56_04380 [Verrucomicrobiota bacterium]
MPVKPQGPNSRPPGKGKLNLEGPGQREPPPRFFPLYLTGPLILFGLWETVDGSLTVHTTFPTANSSDCGPTARRDGEFARPPRNKSWSGFAN